MPPSTAHQRSYTISLRAARTPPASSHTSPLPAPRPPPLSHKPSKSTPNAAAPAMSLLCTAEPLPGLATRCLAPAPVDSLPRHNRELTLRRYLLLQEEHESIHRSLDQLSPSTSSSSSSSSPGLSPVRRHHHHHRRDDSAARRASHELPPRRTRSDEVVASEEAKLFAINEGIKRSLTELLNCETVRSDQAFRQWIMARLMEVEKELRVGRRRRSCPTE